VPRGMGVSPMSPGTRSLKNVAPAYALRGFRRRLRLWRDKPAGTASWSKPRSGIRMIPAVGLAKEGQSLRSRVAGGYCVRRSPRGRGDVGGRLARPAF
jgi:hypothetical protein